MTDGLLTLAAMTRMALSFTRGEITGVRFTVRQFPSVTEHDKPAWLVEDVAVQRPAQLIPPIWETA